MSNDSDIQYMSRPQLKAEIMRLRAGIRQHRDSSGHELCWYWPELWNLLPESPLRGIEVPDTKEFLERCCIYRKSLDDTRLPS